MGVAGCCYCYRHLFRYYSVDIIGTHSHENTCSDDIHLKQLKILHNLSYIEFWYIYAIMLMINWNDLQSTANNDYSFHFISCYYISSHCIYKCLKWQIKIDNAKWNKKEENCTYFYWKLNTKCEMSVMRMLNERAFKPTHTHTQSCKWKENVISRGKKIKWVGNKQSIVGERCSVAKPSQSDCYFLYLPNTV